MNAVAETERAAISSLPAIGAPYGGGHFAGVINIAGFMFGLVVAPKAVGEVKMPWASKVASVAGACSYFDGAANTAAMAAAGSALASWARGLDIDGQSDWYIPAQDELEIIYRNLKPTTEENALYGRSGLNASAVPPTHAYSATAPLQTAAEAFGVDGSEALEEAWYWSSTQHADGSDCAWLQFFDYGYQFNGRKSNTYRARAVRRFPI